MSIITRSLPLTITPRCSAGATAKVSQLAFGWVIHPSSYDPAEIDREDVEHDHALRLLTLDEEGMLEEMLEKAMSRPERSFGTVQDYRTNDFIRAATEAERDASIAAARRDGGVGAIDDPLCPGRTVFVEE